MKWVKCPPVLHQFWQYRGLGSTALLQKTDKQITLTTENKGERMNKSPSLISSIATSFWHWLIVFLFSLSLEKSKKAFYLLQPRRKLGDYRKYNTHIVNGYTTSDQLDFLLLKWTDKRPAAKNSRKKNSSLFLNNIYVSEQWSNSKLEPHNANCTGPAELHFATSLIFSLLSLNPDKFS